MKITVSVVQMAVARGKPEENLRKAEAFLAEAKARKSDLVCFPEMWTTGFDWEYNARMVGAQKAVIAQVAAMARRHGVWLNGSLLAEAPGGRPANTSILFTPDGEEAAVYRKTHLFTLLHEDRHMAPGERLALAGTPWGPTGLSICYDIRFPELFRTYALEGAVMILSPMAFPHPRLRHWQTLLTARAIEDQLFMVGANCVGTEDFGPDGTVTYCGNSAIIDPWGETVVAANGTDETLITAAVDTGRVDEVRRTIAVLRDRRPELYRLGPPGKGGSQ